MQNASEVDIPGHHTQREARELDSRYAFMIHKFKIMPCLSNMEETEMEIETVKTQAKLFEGFRLQLEVLAARYHEQGKSKLEQILQGVLHPD